MNLFPLNPYSVKIKNNADTEQVVKLFDINWLLRPHQRNPEVKIEACNSSMTYEEMCVELMLSFCRIGMVRINNISLAVTETMLREKLSPLMFIQKYDAGTVVTIPIQVDMSAFQFQTSVYEIKLRPDELNLSSLASIQFTLVAQAGITIHFYPSQKVEFKKLAYDYLIKMEEEAAKSVVTEKVNVKVPHEKETIPEPERRDEPKISEQL